MYWAIYSEIGQSTHLLAARVGMLLDLPARLKDRLEPPLRAANSIADRSTHEWIHAFLPAPFAHSSYVLLNGMIIGQLQVYGLARVVVTMAAVVPPPAGSTDRPPDD